MNTYYLCVTQPTNVGDLVINKMMIDELSKYGKVYVDCYNTPDSFRRCLFSDNKNLIDVYKENKISLKRLDLIRVYKLLKSRGVQLFVTSPGPIGNSNKKISMMSIAFMLINKTITFAGAKYYSIGNCCSEAIANNNVIQNKYVDHYYMRSYASVDYMKLNKKRASYIPDLAYLLFRKVVSLPKKKIALMSFRKVNVNDVEFEDWFSSAVDLLVEKGYQIILYYQVKSDKSFMEHLFSLKKSINVSFREDIVWYDNFSIYQEADLVISNRLHSLLIGAVYNVLPLAYLTNDASVAKIRDVLESSFMGNHNHYMLESQDSNSLLELVNNAEKYHEEINDIVNNNASLCELIFAEIASSFKN